MLAIIESDKSPTCPAEISQYLNRYDRDTKYFIAHLSIAFILLPLSIMTPMTSAKQTDIKTSTQIQAYARRRRIRYRIIYRRNSWLGKPKQVRRRQRSMVGSCKKFRRPDGNFSASRVSRLIDEDPDRNRQP